MTNRALSFVGIPGRSEKPRRVGLTLARDLGLGYAEAESWMEAVGEFIDYIKIRHLFVLLMRDDPRDLVVRKIQLYRHHAIDVNPGGIVFEMAWLDNAAQPLFQRLAQLGFTAVECSENIITLTLQQKLEAIRQARAAGLKVLFEVGEKYPTDAFDVQQAATEILAMRDAGCELCILERSQIEQCLGPDAANPQSERLIRLVELVGLENIVFEAESLNHQQWLFQTFGAEVNLGPNLDKDVIPKLEPTRRTLSREGGYGYLFDKIAQRERQR
ncbi:phosphosulfolactate synthase [Brenneria corticis]|uniref:Phosphosulfolactate synthase n=1 Tax=Brenneria corticis TaxID=2173106 RepID=A0A2U1UCW0_9GAMM|nr:phosphosulfolactate synthase [Brenneria sp. CFCC 11842]PWC19516.1 hypothetical protein DDT56_00635 [Brenneria sp. CFCC 11842]